VSAEGPASATLTGAAVDAPPTGARDERAPNEAARSMRRLAAGANSAYLGLMKCTRTL
jgi:hypothetical protein